MTFGTVVNNVNVKVKGIEIGLGWKVGRLELEEK